MDLKEIADLATSTAASLARLGSGAYVAHVGKRPAKMLELYERETCPFSRKAREALTILDLDAIIHPCPEGGTRFRARVEAIAGKYTVPVLVDPNTDTQLAESDEIVRHLFTHYGDGSVPLALRANALTMASSKLASRLRADKAVREESKPPEELVELFSFEAHPQARLVREVLCSLEIPYLLHNVAPGSAKRMRETVVPRLVDRVHGVEIDGAHAIIEHLHERYARAA